MSKNRKKRKQKRGPTEAKGPIGKLMRQHVEESIAISKIFMDAVPEALKEMVEKARRMEG